MAIKKNLTITVKEDKATLNEKMYIYRDDVGVEFYLEILSFNVSFSSNQTIQNRTTNLLSGLENAYADIRFLAPNGTITVMTGIPKFEVIDNKVIFKVEKTLTDELTDVGEYSLQIHLYDNNGVSGTSNRITIPPVPFEVKDYFK